MNNLDGYWRITGMSEWDQTFVDLVEPGHFVFDKGKGHLVFGAVTGDIDGRVSADGARIDFSWAGMDENDPASGRGWVESVGPDEARGHLFMHNGDDSIVRLIRQT